MTDNDYTRITGESMYNEDYARLTDERLVARISLVDKCKCQTCQEKKDGYLRLLEKRRHSWQET